MTIQDLRTLLDYHYWARDRMFENVAPLSPDQLKRDMNNSFRSIHDTIVHIYAAEWAWHSRWNGTSPAALIAGDAFADVAAVRAAWIEHEAKMRAFVEALGEQGIHKPFEYKLLSGAAGSTPFAEMLQHVVNHASYHRGQITTMMRQMGAKPGASMDMIAFFRARG
jgi:uncharacterized damage-inducible protein DinB